MSSIQAHVTPLLVRAVGGSWSPPEETAYSEEAHLQEVLGDQPTLLPGVGTNPVAVREIQTGSGPLDLLAIDSEGQLTLVECKLASNAEIRRKIVGQVFDYAASFWQMSFDELDHRWRQRREDSKGIVASLGVDGDEAVELVAAIEANLANGRFSLVLAVDLINDGLRRMVEFLNDRTADGLTVVALQLQYAKHSGVEILVPTVFGSELAHAKAVKAGTNESWSEEDVAAYLGRHWPNELAVVDALADQIRQLPGFTFVGTKASTPSMIAKWETGPGTAWPFVIYTSPTPRLQVNFHWMKVVSDDVKMAIARCIEAMSSGINAAEIAAAGFNKKPSIPLSTLTDDAVAEFVGVFATASGTELRSEKSLCRGRD